MIDSATCVNMAFQAFLVLLHGVTFLANAATIRTPVNQNAGSGSLQLLTNITEPTSTLLTAISEPHTSQASTSLTDEEPYCLDGLGVDMDPASCRNVIQKIPRTTDYITIGFRGKGNFDLTMPYIFISGV